DDVQLARQERTRFVLLAVRELDAVRPVDGHGVDVEALEGLENRLAGATVERDPLLDLRRLRAVLEQHHVCKRMTRPHDRHSGASGLSHLVRQIVDLDDGLLEVLLVDLVGRRHASTSFGTSERVPWPGPSTSGPGGTRASAAAAEPGPSAG